MKKLLPYTFALAMLAACSPQQKEDAHLDNTQTQTTNAEQSVESDSINQPVVADTAAAQPGDTAHN